MMIEWMIFVLTSFVYLGAGLALVELTEQYRIKSKMPIAGQITVALLWPVALVAGLIQWFVKYHVVKRP